MLFSFVTAPAQMLKAMPVLKSKRYFFSQFFFLLLKLIDDRYNKKSLSFLFSKGLGVWAQYKMWNVSHYSTWMKTKTNHKEALNVEPNTVCGHIYGTFGTALKNGYLKWLFCPIMTINNFRFDIKIEHLCCPKSLMSKKHVSNGMFP